jgi:hypothetical protein
MSYQRLIVPHRQSGRRKNSRRKKVAAQFGLTPCMSTHEKLPDTLLDQLDRCKNVAAKRILLGVSQ